MYEQILSFLIKHWSQIKKFTKLNNKQLSIFIFLIIAVLVVLVAYLMKSKQFNVQESDLRDVRSNISLKDSEIEKLKAENKRLRDQVQTLGDYTPDEPKGILLNNEDFVRDWNIDDFYPRNGNEYCPKPKGGNNYQRMVYKRLTSLANSNLYLKFEMVDENEDLDYQQRFVTGMTGVEGPIVEYDIPSKNAGQTVNYRERNDSFDVIPPGESLPSQIKEGGTVNLTFNTSLVNADKIAVNMNLGYFSNIDLYGSQTKDFSHTYSTQDTRPENLTANMFIGSYKGGCIRVLDWSVN